MIHIQPVVWFIFVTLTHWTLDMQIMYCYILCITRILARYAPCCNIVVESISKFCIDSQCLILSGELITVYVLWFLTLLIHVTSLIVHNFLVLGILGKYTLIYFAEAFICVVSGLNKHWFGVFLMFIKWGLGIKLIKH